MFRVYPASRFFRAPMWIECGQKYRIFMCARWLKGWQKDIPETSFNSRKFWMDNLEDIATCDYLVAYAEKDDVLGGALIEIGAALSMNKPVYLVGENEAFRSWIHHPNIMIKKTLHNVFNELENRYSITHGTTK